ncbi:Serine/threonine-protein phosphatase 2A activator 1 [Saxophila tyrrhenica]|uniref:Serine/threonine-protein phosphatase 2A activator n=1 Tax=Saxophila tyrrhenica TaxID=1690608 RepID=A0AAV9P5D0_9PEZI|nr:Serine/threonine-protein phosphatase 2A activator 1 [Saxophila tyrrhenica]
MAAPPPIPTLERLPASAEHTFSSPSKRINDGDDLQFFHTSTAYQDLVTWLLQLSRSMFPTRESGSDVQPSTLDSPPPFSSTVQSLQDLVSDLEALTKDAPPDTGPRRFGNVAFRTWFKLMEEALDQLLDKHLVPLLQRYERQQSALKDELGAYLLGSFGSAQRLDYGTGHELSFLAFLGCLWKLNAFEDGEERAIVMGVMQPYLILVRVLINTYTLEPAGSHGVWGLDDHSHLPYIFGSAQLGPAIDVTAQPPQPTPTEGSSPNSPLPSSVTDKALVADLAESNMYFSAIAFIYAVKRGPFWEHSPVLYDVSGIKDGWGKINKGMVKMWVAEVLGKFPVVQHFVFGSLWRWERHESVMADGAKTAHAASQPRSGQQAPGSMPPPGGAGTKAPWAKPGVGGAEVGNGVPSMRAPWAGTRQQHAGPSHMGATQRPPAASGMPPTAAPWAATQRPAPSNATAGVSRTPAPRRDGG